MKRYAFAMAALLFLSSPWRQTPTADQTAYTVEALGTSGNIGNLLPAETGINASGEVVGTVNDNSLGQRAVRYTDANGWEYVPSLTWGSTAAAVNVHGDIVGTLRVNGQTHGYRYNAASNTVDDMGVLPNGNFSEALGINDNGDVAGDGTTTGGAQLAFLARRGQPLVVLPDPGGGFAQPCGINNAGQIAMTILTAQGFEHAARLEMDNTYTDAKTLDSNPAGFSACFGMDQLGNVGGFSSANNFATSPGFRFDGTTMINVLTGLPGTNGSVQALANGNAAGYFNSTVDGLSHAMLYTDANGAVDLNQQIPSGSGWLLTQIMGINASGQMVGDGMLNGAQTVFRLNPTKTKDTTPPVIGPHADVTAEATGSNGASVTYTAPATTDNVDPNGTATCAPVSGSTFALGTTTVTCNATDAAGNAATPTTFKVTVVDTTAPVISAHADVSAEATGPTGATVAYDSPSTTDAVDGNRTATCAPASGSTFVLGTTTVTCQAMDAAGNAATPTTFKVVVKDTTAPVIAPHADVTAEATGPTGATVAYTAPTTTDAVDGSRTASCAPASGSTFALGTTTVTCQAMDAAGNAATPTTFKVVVKDTTAPVIAPHADVMAEATGPKGATVAYNAPSTTDAVDGNGTATCAPASGSTFALGTTIVTCNAKDAAGNSASATTFKVIVRDTTPPVISAIYASPNAIWPPNGKLVPVSVIVTATDNTDPLPTCSLSSVSGGEAGSSAVTGALSANLRADNGTVYVLTVTCSDVSGNKSSAFTTVVVGKTSDNNATSTVNAKSPTTGRDRDRDRDRDAKHDRADKRR